MIQNYGVIKYAVRNVLNCKPLAAEFVSNGFTDSTVLGVSQLFSSVRHTLAGLGWWLNGTRHDMYMALRSAVASARQVIVRPFAEFRILVNSELKLSIAIRVAGDSSRTARMHAMAKE